jgi:hypothetical protein
LLLMFKDLVWDLDCFSFMKHGIQIHNLGTVHVLFMFAPDPFSSYPRYKIWNWKHVYFVFPPDLLSSYPRYTIT